MEKQDAVVAMTCGTRNMQGVMNLVWEKLLPAMQTKRLKADKEAQKKLKERLVGLMLRPQQGSGAPGVAAPPAGKTYTFPTNNLKIETIALKIGASGEVTLTMRCNGVEQSVACGNGEWKHGRMAYAQLAEQPVAVSGAWTGDGIYTAKLCFYETPFVITAKLQFSGDQLLCDLESNVGFGQTKQPQLIGVLQ
jgi:hypothetical protein